MLLFAPVQRQAASLKCPHICLSMQTYKDEGQTINTHLHGCPHHAVNTHLNKPQLHIPKRNKSPAKGIPGKRFLL